MRRSGSHASASSASTGSWCRSWGISGKRATSSSTVIVLLQWPAPARPGACTPRLYAPRAGRRLLTRALPVAQVDDLLGRGGRAALERAGLVHQANHVAQAGHVDARLAG